MAQWRIKFEDLDFGERIGKGNFGEVYRGSYLGTDVAIKRLFFVDDDFMQKYIEREMDTLTQLNHPNIVQLMGLCIGLEDLYIVTEFVNGGNLNQKLVDRTVELDWKLRVALLRDFALAMSFLHNKGIIHRDLKSHNLLVTDEWKLKVCDFGLARPAPEGEEEKQGMTIVGTNEWMAPEVALGEKYDASCDVFSYGMVVYELIMREEPPIRKLRDGFCFKPADYTAKLPSDCPPKLWDLLCDCAADERTNRPDFKGIVTRIKEIYETVPAAAAKSASEAPKKKKKKKKTTTKDGEGDKPKKKKSTKSASSKSKTSSTADGEKPKKKRSTKKVSLSPRGKTSS
eukprot:TRINITY_DN607_c0_g2_i1.p1 TRINITY_DN607_c0_g2~~TRINITY_DN607_c0_g2_i1.p1  ORF type:complete len:342 (-),score=88.31 TRINITY_DN607_c0_g2_i1:148-1173(-)